MYDWAPIRAISEVFKWLLDGIYMLVPSYGWSIILLTILFRALLLPLDIKQKVSMKKMSTLQPKIAAINEKYKNDKEKAAQKTMELYREEKASPFSGCLPSLIQLPLFFAFFGALQIIAGQEMLAMFNTMKDLLVQYGDAANIPADMWPKMQSWLWVHNIWQPDTALFSVVPQGGAFTFMGLDSHIIPPFQAVQHFKGFKDVVDADVYNTVMRPLMERYSTNWNGWFILPVLAGVSSFLQTKITMPPQPANPDPKAPANPFSSKTMMYIFPLMSVYFTATSNSVFALYWFTSNICVTVTYKLFDLYWTRKTKQKEAEEAARLEQQKKEEAERIAAAAALKAARAEAKSKPKEGKK